MAITSNFNPTTGVLTTTGDSHANTITNSRDAAGQIFVNGGAVSINGGPATVANTTEIQVSGGAGNDTISVDETNGRLPAAQLSGGAGNDTITGGSGADRLLGDAGNDVLIGERGNDELFGGAGNDLFIWNPGDGSDVVEGGTGKDTRARSTSTATGARASPWSLTPKRARSRRASASLSARTRRRGSFRNSGTATPERSIAGREKPSTRRMSATRRIGVAQAATLR
jgi:Ca2+-binding RTX toxin-like protein